MHDCILCAAFSMKGFPVKVDLFDFDLPQTHIAQHPAQPKDGARLLVGPTDVGGMADKGVLDLPDFLHPGDVVVFNDTRVIPVRLFGRRNTAGINITLHKQEAADTWRAFARPAKKLHVGDRVAFADGFAATVQAKGLGGEVTLVFNVSGPELMAALEAQGAMPLPPYIKRARGGEGKDRSDYQTIFAAHPGAVAAPTAGLHFTRSLLEAIEKRDVKMVKVTLHVGAGTFLPIKVANTQDHVMHTEWGEITLEAANIINKTRAAGGRLVAVGTTALRLLESAAEADGRIAPFQGETGIFITPGYRFRAVDVLMTNFHLPRSTLFMLVCAFAGFSRMKALYAHAIAANYRFYSYGDACLLTRTEDPTL